MLRFFLAACCLFSVALADTLTLRDGKTVNGIYLGGDSRSVKMAVGDKVDTYAVDQISTLRFGAAVAQTTSGAAVASEPAAIAAGKQIASGTAIVVRMIDSIDSGRDGVGQTFRASLDEPVMQNGNPVIPRGADVLVKLTEDRQAGRLTGRTELSLNLVSIKVNGKPIEVTSAQVTQESDSQTAKTAKTAGGLAAVGAIIGGIAGGGKGAAIGAAAGAGTGTAVTVMTKGPKVFIPSETRLTFTLEQPFRI